MPTQTNVSLSDLQILAQTGGVLILTQLLTILAASQLQRKTDFYSSKSPNYGREFYRGLVDLQTAIRQRFDMQATNDSAAQGVHNAMSTHSRFWGCQRYYLQVSKPTQRRLSLSKRFGFCTATLVSKNAHSSEVTQSCCCRKRIYYLLPAVRCLSRENP